MSNLNFLRNTQMAQLEPRGGPSLPGIGLVYCSECLLPESKNPDRRKGCIIQFPFDNSFSQSLPKKLSSLPEVAHVYFR